MTVTLIGAGPIGGRIVQSLLQHGVQKIKVLDGRIADDLWHSCMPVGLTTDRNDRRPAHLVLCEALAKRGYTGLEPITAPLDSSGVQEALVGTDLLVLALEQQDLRLAHLINRFCLRERKPWLITMIDGNLGLVGPLFVPCQTACFNDFRTLVDSANPSPEMNRKHRQHILQRGHASFFAGLPSYADIVAGYSSLATVHFLLRNSSYVLGRVLIVDFDNMRVDVEDVLKLPRCPVCSAQKNVYRPPFSAEIVTPS